MGRIKSQRLKEWIIAIIVVCFSFVINIFISRWSGLELIFSEQNYEDSNLRSLYEKLSFNGPIYEQNDNIVIIPTDSVSREDLSELLLKLDSYNPSVIGVDLLFSQMTEKDSVLSNSISQLQNKLVFPLKGYSDNSQGNGFADAYGFFSNPSFPDLNYGFVNLGQSNKTNKIIRYQSLFNYKNEKIPSFGYLIASLYPTRHRDLNEVKDSFLLEFGNVYFRIIPASDVINANIDNKKLEGKILILGDIYDPQDIHPTIVGDLAGAYIHAYAVNSLINNVEKNSPNKVVSFIIVFLITLLFAWILNYGKFSLGDIGNLFVRIIQLILLLTIYFIGSILFIKCNIAFNWLLPLSMIAIEAFVFDVINGVIFFFSKSK